MTFAVAAEMYDRFVGRYSEALGRALAAKAEPAREGKKIVFDSELSVNAVSQGGIAFEVPA